MMLSVGGGDGSDESGRSIGDMLAVVISMKNNQ
jgi:hypothetical protein